MKSMPLMLFTIVVTGATGCIESTNPRPPCTIALASEGNSTDQLLCRDALVIALRETESLSPTDNELASIDTVISAARKSSCVFDSAHATYEYFSWDEPVVRSTYAPIVDAWTIGEIETGDPLVDSLFLDSGAVEVEGTFYVKFDRPISYDVLSELVQQIPETTAVQERNESSAPDIRREPVEGGWEVTFKVAWGDCIAGCAYSHEWVVFVTADLSQTTVIAEDGDDLASQFSCTDSN